MEESKSCQWGQSRKDWWNEIGVSKEKLSLDIEDVNRCIEKPEPPK